MRIRRGLLFWGLFLIPLGAIPLLARSGVIDPAALTDVWRLWPVALILLGLVVLLGRRGAGLVGVTVAALALGGLAGGVLAAGVSGLGPLGPVGECAGTSADMETASERGSFSGSARIDIDLDCGTLDLTTAAGSDWQLDARYRGAAPVVDADGRSLRLGEPDRAERHRQEWRLAVPAGATESIQLRANAATSSLDLAGTELARLEATVNAGDVAIDGSAATISGIDLDLNAGRIRVTLADAPTTGQMSVNAGAIELCVPPGVGLDLEVEEQFTFSHDLAGKGLTQAGDRWTRPAQGDAATVRLEIDGNAASLTLDPEGGCS